MDDLIAFVRAQLDEDERLARMTEPNQDFTKLREWAARKGIGMFLIADSADVLAEVESKRRILELTIELQEREGRYAAPFVLALAQPYADREGWREEWRT